MNITSREALTSIVDLFDTFLFDCDGVLYNGDMAIDGAVEVTDMLRLKGKKLIFVTNTSSKSRQDCKHKFDRLGFHVEMDEIFCASYAAAVYISSVLKLPPTDKVYLIGMSGMETELAGQGISWIGGTSTEDTQLGPFDLPNFERDASVKAVLCGGDTFITYTKLSKAFQYLIGENPCQFLSVNLDRVVVGAGGIHLGAGTLTHSLSCALGREPLLLGKPGRAMWDCIIAKHSIEPSKTLIIGDTISIDIAFGKNVGITTMLALSGVTTADTVLLTAPSDLPDYVINSLGDFRALDSSTDPSSNQASIS